MKPSAHGPRLPLAGRNGKKALTTFQTKPSTPFTAKPRPTSWLKRSLARQRGRPWTSPSSSGPRSSVPLPSLWLSSSGSRGRPPRQCQAVLTSTHTKPVNLASAVSSTRRNGDDQTRLPHPPRPVPPTIYDLFIFWEKSNFCVTRDLLF